MINILNSFPSELFFDTLQNMSKQKEKIDKRAAALRDNLKRRKLKHKTEEKNSKESPSNGTQTNQ